MNAAANLSLLFDNAVPLGERCMRVARAGFRNVEILYPYDQPIQTYVQALKASQLRCVLMNTPVNGHSGLAAVQGREAQFQEELLQALNVAQALGCPMVHVMAGSQADGPLSRDTFLKNMEFAVKHAQSHGITLNLEALNREDFPGYFYWHPQVASALIETVSSPWLRLQFDFYHAAKEELDTEDLLLRFGKQVSHVQLAGLRARGEPEDELATYARGLEVLKSQGYQGYVGCEYKPRKSFESGIAWMQPLLNGKNLQLG